MTTTSPKPFVFVLMPFQREFDDVYQLGIKKACEAAGAYAERVDEQIFQESILQRVYNQIAKADVVVADMSGRNPNVFYEAGYAHALGKPVILLTQRADDIPFDLKHYPHIIYESRIVDLARELEKRVRYLIENPQTPFLQNPFEIQVNDIWIVNNPTIGIPIPESVIGFNVAVDVYNSTQDAIRTAVCQVGLLTPPLFVRATLEREGKAKTVTLSSEQRLHYSSDRIELLPGAWEKLRFMPLTDNVGLPRGATFNLAVRIFTEAGHHDYPFIARLVVPGQD